MFLVAMLLTAPVAIPAGTTRAQNEADAAALHRRMDANRDGYVTYAEIRAAAAAMVIPRGHATDRLPDDRIGRAAFDQADANHDGRISLAESIAGADRTFDEADTDHDGVLSADERGAYAARSLAVLQSEMAQWKPLPCRPGAACATIRPAEPPAPAAAFQAMAPADRLDRLDRFRAALPFADRRRLDRALPRSPDGGVARCDRTEGSRASCEAAAYLPALRSTRLMPRFLMALRQDRSVTTPGLASLQR